MVGVQPFGRFEARDGERHLRVVLRIVADLDGERLAILDLATEKRLARVEADGVERLFAGFEQMAHNAAARQHDFTVL